MVYVKPANFKASNSETIASRMEMLNSRFREDKDPETGRGRGYVLVGPGRWGSSDPWLGIPVKWSQISEARIIVESGLENFRIDPSQGTHFFHNLTAAGIGYFSLCESSEREFVRWDLLEALPGEEIAPGVRHVRLAQPLSVRMDGQTQQGVISL